MRYTFECQKCGLTGESAEPVGSPCGEEVTTDDGREVECDGQIIVSGADWTRDTLARAVATCAPAYLRWEWDEDHDRMIPFERHVHSDCPFDPASVFRMLYELGYMGYWVTVGDNPVLGCKDCQLARKGDPTFEISHFPGPILGWAVASAFVAARQAGNSANAANCPVSEPETAHETVNSDPTKGEEK